MDRFKFLLNDHTGTILTRDLFVQGNKNLEVLIFIMVSAHQQIFRGATCDVTGELKFKIKQLKLLGFLPIVVIFCTCCYQFNSSI